MMPLKILIADDEPEIRSGIASALLLKGCQVREASDGLQALEMLSQYDFDLVLLDVRMPQLNGLETLKQIKASKSLTAVAIITAHANLSDAVKAIQDGAFDYIEKPLQTGKLEELVEKAFKARNLIHQMTLSRPSDGSSSQESSEDVALDGEIVGHAQAMQKVFKMVDRLAHVSTSVLIRGENGTGKELVARAIHYNSPRKNNPFVAVNCGAIPEALMESEFFGHEKGAFTGAHQRKIGKFQFASGGTLFLDEIGDLPLAMQVKLLRVLQDQKFTPVGSLREVKVDVRIIAATNRDLEKLMSEEKFREDLFYRLNVMPISLPPLRDRVSDIPLLAEAFIVKFNEKHSRSIQALMPEALEVLVKYRWPGNIRELENAIEYAFVVETEKTIRLESLPDVIQESVLDAEEGWRLPSSSGAAEVAPEQLWTFSLDYQQDKDRFEKDFIVHALKSNQGKINQTCERANIPKNTLLRKIRKYGINPRDFEN